MNVKYLVTGALLAATLAANAQGATTSASSWPTKPLRLIVPFPPGSSTDAAARAVGARLAISLGQQVVIDNRAGASGNIGAQTAARSAPDGYTLLLGTASTHAVAVSVQPDLKYDPVADFAPVSLVGSSPYVLAVHPGVAANNVKELIAVARARPGQLTYGSAGTASLGHLAGELFSSMAGVKFNHVPYKSSAAAVFDVLSGRINLQFGSIAPTLPHIRSGKLRALAVTGATRLSALPEVPTVAEQALPGFEVSLWMGILVPARTSDAIVSRLNREITAILSTAEMKETLSGQGVEASPSTSSAFGSRIRDEIAKWAKVVKVANVRAE